MTVTGSTTAAVGRRLTLAWLIALGVSIVTLVVCLLVQLVFGDGSRLSATVAFVLPIAALLPVFCTGGLIAAAVMQRAALGFFMLAAMALLVVAMSWFAILISSRAGDDAEPSLRVPVTLALVGFAVAFVGYLLTSPPAPVLGRLRTWLVFSITLLCYALLAILWSRWWQSRQEVLIVLLALGGGGTVLGTPLLLVAGRIIRMRERRRIESLLNRGGLELICPRCNLEQELPTGMSRCRRCGLAILIEVEEPRCACGYLLYRLSGETCPECGRPVRA